MPNAQTAALYARISRDLTGEALGVKRQLEDGRKLAADRGWVIAEEYVDNDISAYGGKQRPEYQRMLEDIEAGRRDAVIVYNLDRLTRRPIELEQFTAICEQAGVTQFATVTADIDLGSGDGMLMARMLAAFAAMESDKKSQRLRRKAREIAESGRPGGGGMRPFGYQVDRVTVIESEAAIVREVVARYLAGESLMSLTTWMQAEGVRSVAGLPWRTSTLRTLLVNPRIAGLRAHRGEVVGPAVWAAIITPAQHEQVLSLMDRRKLTGRRTARRYLLSGMLRCGKCGNKLFSSARREGDRNRRRYVCSSSPDHGGCGKLTVVAEPVEEWIAEAVLMRLDSPAMADALAGRAASDERHAVLLTDLRADQEQMEELAAEWGAKRITSAVWKAAREPIEERMRKAERQLSQLTGTTALDGLIGNGDELRRSWDGLNLTRQAAIVAAVLDFATIAPGTPNARGMDPARIIPTWRL
jgi:DNA invertase Pin-like site-specific DNA recombinase